MYRKKIYYGLIALFFLTSATSAHATFIVTEWLSWAEKKIQTVTEKLADIDMKETLQQKKEQLAAQDPNADKKKNPAPDNKSGITQSEIAPYVDPRITAELNKEDPSIPVVEGLLKETIVYNSKTVSESGSIEERKKSKNAQVNNDASKDNSLEKQQAQALISYDNGRALARRVQDASEMVSADNEEMEADKNSRTTTGSLYKGSASITHKTHQLINEIAVLRNSRMEIAAMDAIQGEEVAEKKDLIDTVKDAAKSALGG